MATDLKDGNRNLPGSATSPVGGPNDGAPLTPAESAKFDQITTGFLPGQEVADTLADMAEMEAAAPVNPVQTMVENNLGISPPVSRSPATGPASSTPVPIRSRKPKPAKSGTNGTNSEPGSEAKSLSDVINRSKDKKLKSLDAEANAYKKTKFGKFNIAGRGRKKFKKWIIGSLVVAVTAAAVSIVSIIPTAIESLLMGATTSYSNFSMEGVIKKAFNEYFKEDVLVPKCRERGGSGEKCNVGESTKTGLIGRAKEDMRANRMDKKLLDQGIQWDYDVGRDEYTFFKTKDGSPLELDRHTSLGDLDMFALGKNEGSKYIDSLVRDTVNNESRWKKYFIRGPTVRAMRTRTGSTGCFFLCQQKDSYNKAKKWPKKAFARFIKTNVLSPQSDFLSNILECMMEGDSKCTSRKTVEFARGKISQAATRMFDEKVAKEVLEAFDGALKKGPGRYVAEKALQLLLEKISSHVAEAAAGNIIGVVLLINTIGKWIETITDKLPKMIRIMSMMALALVASTFIIMINEARQGKLPFADYAAMLSTFIGIGGSRIFATMFMGSESSTAKDGQPYACNNAAAGGVAGAVSGFLSDGSMGSGDLTCDTFKLDYTPGIADNKFLKKIADLRSAFKSLCVGPLCVDTITDAVDWFNDILGKVTSSLTSKIPGFDKLMEYINEKSQTFSSAILSSISPSIVTDDFAGTIAQAGKGAGARVFDAIVGGASVINQYLTPAQELGGGVLDLTAQAELDSAIAQQQAQDIRYASIYDRFFNLDYTDGIGTSVLTQFAASLPGQYNVANLVNPLQNLDMAFNRVSGKQAYADQGSMARVMSTAFAVPVRGHKLADIEDIQTGKKPLPDPDSPECKQEISNFKSQADSRTDSTNDDEVDSLGFGVPDGASTCMLAETALKVQTTGRNKTNDFVICETGTPECSSGSSGSGSAEGPLPGGLGECPGVAKFRPNEGKPLNDVELQQLPGKRIKIRTEFCTNVANMVEAAAAAGVTLDGGGFRTYDEQVGLRIDHCKGADGVASEDDIYKKSPSACTPDTARPGESNHEKGIAIDFENCSYRSTSCYKWLAANAATYGFKNLPSEAWHWSTNGG